MNDDLLIQRYLDGSLSREDLAVLNQRLRDEADLRQHLREIAEQVVAFGDLARRETDTPVCYPKRPDKSVWLTSLALAASIAVLAASAWLFLASKPDAVLTLVESTGTVAWSDGTVIASGETVPAGTLETVGEASSALLRFEDGSLITLHGDAELSFASEHHKVLSLTRGTLSAEVRPQPAGRPMLIRTPSAVAEVVGTAFDLSTRSEDTLLKVNEGLVKLKRLADGSEIDVPANRSAVASLDTGAALDAASTPEPLTAWRFDFTTSTPPRDWRGISKGGTMHASPYVAKKMPDGRIVTHHGISIRTAMLEQPSRLLGTERSVIRYRLRRKQAGTLHIMLLTHRKDGEFGGNFLTRLDESELHPAADGWCEVEVPISRFSAVSKSHAGPWGNILTSVLIFSASADTRLEVSNFALLTK
ncbi:MAG: FecR domain-containing protein [Verrucomicrobiaceae bacterium]|nr:FecR domain-containing protein [Verrucomicrobiaceae bacterium]